MAIKFNPFLLLCLLTLKFASSVQEDKRSSYSPTQRTITKWSCGILVDCFYFEVTHPHCGKGTAVLDGSDYAITFKAQNSCKQHAIKKLSVYWFELFNNKGITYARCSNQQRCVLSGKSLAALKGNLQLYIRIKVPTSHQIITLPVFLKLEPKVQRNTDEWNCNKTNVTKKTKSELHNNNNNNKLHNNNNNNKLHNNNNKLHDNNNKKKNSTKGPQDTYSGFLQRIHPKHSNTSMKSKAKHISFDSGESPESKLRKWKTLKDKAEGQPKFGNNKGKTDKADNTKNLKIKDGNNLKTDTLKSFDARLDKTNKPPELTDEEETAGEEEIVTKSYDGLSVNGVNKTLQKPKTKNVMVKSSKAKIVDNSKFKKLTDHYQLKNRKLGSFPMSSDKSYLQSDLIDEEEKPVGGPTTANGTEFAKMRQDFLSVNEANITIKENMKNVAKCLNFFCSHPHTQGCVRRQVMQCIHYAEGANNEKILKSIKHDMLNLLGFFNVTSKDLNNIEKFAKSVAVKLSSNDSSGLSRTQFGAATANILSMLYNASYQGSRRAMHDMLIAKSNNALEVQKKRKNVTLTSCLQLCGHKGSHLKWTSWEPWSSCTSSCGKSLTIRLKTCIRGHFNPPQNAKHCDGYVKSEAKQCKYRPCPTDRITSTGGRWSFWSHWSACSVTCGLGRESTTRSCKMREEDNAIFDREPTDHQEKILPCKGSPSRTRMCITSSCNLDSEPEIRKVVEGSDTLLQCGLDQGPMRTVYWITPTGQKISKLTNQSRFHIRNDDLVVKETQRYDSGVYHCIVKKGHQQSTVDTKIEVLTCLSYPCQNGGSCKIKHRPRRKHMVDCLCRHGFHGNVCQYQTERLSYAFILTIILLMVLIFIIILGIFLGISTLRKKQKPEPNSSLPAHVYSESSGSKDNKDPEKPLLQDCEPDKQQDLDSSIVRNDGSWVEITQKDFHEVKGDNWFKTHKMKKAQSDIPVVTRKKSTDETSIPKKRFASDPGLTTYLSRQLSNIKKPQRHRSIEDFNTPTSSIDQTISKHVRSAESIASSLSAKVKKKVSFQKGKQRKTSQDTFKDHIVKDAPVRSSNHLQIPPDSNVSVERSVYKPPKSDIKLSLESTKDIRLQLDRNDSEDTPGVIYMHPDPNRKASLEDCECAQYHSDNMQLRPNAYFDNGRECDIDMDKIKIIASDSAIGSGENWYDNFGNEVNFKHRTTVRPETRCGTRQMPTTTSKRQRTKLTPNIVTDVNNEDFDDDVQFPKNEHQMDFIHKRTYKSCNIDCNPNDSHIYACLDQENIHHVSSGDSITTLTKNDKHNKKSVYQDCRENSYKMSSPAGIHTMIPQTSKTSTSKQACDSPNFYDKTLSLQRRQMSEDSIKKQLLDSNRTSDPRDKIQFAHKQTYKQNKTNSPNVCHSTATRDREHILVLGSRDFKTVLNKDKQHKEPFEKNYHKHSFKMSAPQRGQSVLPLTSKQRNSKTTSESPYFDAKNSPVQGRKMFTDSFEKLPSGSRRYLSHEEPQGTTSNRVHVTDTDNVELTNTQFSDNLELHGPEYFLTPQAQFPELDNYLDRKSVTQLQKGIHSSQDSVSQISKLKANTNMEGLSSIFKSMTPDLKIVMSKTKGSENNITYSDIQIQDENSKSNVMSEQNRVLYSNTTDWLQEREQDNDTQSLYSEPQEVNHFSHTNSSKPVFATIQSTTPPPRTAEQTNYFTDSGQELLLTQIIDVDDYTEFLGSRKDESSKEGESENTKQWGINSDGSEHTITESTLHAEDSRSHSENSIQTSKKSYPKSPFRLEMDKFVGKTWDTSRDDCSLNLQSVSENQSDVEPRPNTGQEFDSPFQYLGEVITPTTSASSSGNSQCSQKPMDGLVTDTTFEFNLNGENKQNLDVTEKDNSSLNLKFEDFDFFFDENDVEEDDDKEQHSNALTSSSPQSDDQTSPRSRMCLNHYQMVYGEIGYRSNSSSPERHCCEEGEVNLQD